MIGLIRRAAALALGLGILFVSAAARRQAVVVSHSDRASSTSAERRTVIGDSVAITAVAAKIRIEQRGADFRVSPWPTRTSRTSPDGPPRRLEPTKIERRRIRIFASALHASITSVMPDSEITLLYVLGPVERGDARTVVTVHQHSPDAYDVFGYTVSYENGKLRVERELYYAAEFDH